MENISLGESTTVPMGSSAVQDALLETNSILQSHADGLQRTNISSSEFSVPYYAECENKRARPWMDGWSSYSNHHFPGTYSRRDNNISLNPLEGNYGQVQREYYGRGYFSSEHPVEGQMEQRWTNQPLTYNRYPQSLTYHSDNLNNSLKWHGYHGHGYHGWNAHSAEQHQAGKYAERPKNRANWGNGSCIYDTTGQPWTNGRQGQPWINDIQWRPLTNDRQQQPWTNDRQPQLWTDDRQRQLWTSDRQPNSWSSWNSPHGYRGQERYGLQNGVITQHRFPTRVESSHTPSTSYGSQSGVGPYRFPVREDSRVYCGRSMVASTLQAADNVDIAAASFGMPSAMSTTNNQAEKMWPFPCEGNPSLVQIKEKCQKFDQDARQAIERSSVHEQSTLVRPPNACLMKKLLILDINGLLADIIFPPPKEDKADINICRRAIFKRPFFDDFLKFCFERFDVAIWSSRRKKILDRVVDHLLGDMRCKLIFCWDQSHCTKTGFKTLENKHKELVLKEIKKVWKQRDADLSWEKGDYDESNTLLLDDSPYKALLNPMHTAVFPHTYSYKDKSDNSLGSEGDLRVYLQDLAMAENVKRYIEEHPFGQQPIDERSSSWAYYLEVITNLAPVQPQI